MRVVIALVVGVVWLGVIPSVGAGEADLDLAVVDASGDTTNAVDVAVAPTATAADQLLTIRNDGGSEATFSLDAIVSGIALTVQPVGGASRTTITLPSGATTAAKLSVTDVTDSTPHSGTLFATSEGMTVQLATVSVQRDAGPSDLLIDGAGDSGVSVNATVTAYRREVLLLPTSPEDISFRMRLSPLTAPDGSQTSIVATADGSVVTPDTDLQTNGQPFSLEIAVELPQPGDYSGSLILSVGDVIATPVPIKITRTSPALQLTVTEPSAPSLTFVLDGSTTIRTSVSSAFPITLERPFLTLNRSSGSAKDAVDPGDYDVRVDDQVVPVGGTFDLAAENARTVIVRLTDLDKAGSYSGTLRFIGDGVSGSAEKPFTFSARRSLVVAVAVLGLGVLLSIGIGLFLGVRAKYFTAGVAAVRLRTELRSLLAAHQVIDEDRRLATDLERRIDLSVEQVTAPFGAEEKALDPLIVRVALLRRVVIVAERLRDAGLKPAPRELVLAQLRTVRSFIVSRGMEKEIPPDCEKAMADAEAAIHPSRDLERRRDRLGRTLASLAPLIGSTERVEQLQTEVGTDLSESDAATVLQRLERIESEVKELLGESIRALVADPAPPGTDDQWTTVREELTDIAERIVAADDLAAVARSYMEAWRILLATLIAGLKGVGGQDADVGRALAKAEGFLRDQLLPQAQSAYQEAIAAYQPAILTEELKIAGAPNSLPEPLPLRFVSLPVEPSREAEVWPKDTLPSESVLYQRMRRFQIVTSALFGALAVLLGLSTLWVPDSDWGNAGDVIAALIWGAGLSGASYAGIAGLMQQFGLSKPAE